MMNQVDRYLGQTLVNGTFTVLTALMSLHYIFGLVEQMRSVGKGDYQLPDAAWFMLLDLPQALVEIFPMAMLLGALLSIGNLATQSELVVLRAAGMSVSRIVVGVVKTGLVLAVAIFILGESIAPKLKNQAEIYRAEKMSSGKVSKSKESLWARDGNHIVYIRSVLSQDYLEGVVIYDVAANQLSLNRIIEAKRARFNDKGVWSLKDATIITFNDEQIVREEKSELSWSSLLSASQLSLLTIEPEELDLAELTDYRKYLENSGIDSSKQDLVFWNKVLQPVSSITMLLLSMGFIFGPLRSGNFGLRLVVGVIAGFLFYLSNKMFGPVTLVYNVPAFIGAAAPIGLALLLSAMLYRKAG
jgi:lipopolysaccharide export system permease protein